MLAINVICDWCNKTVVSAIDDLYMMTNWILPETGETVAKAEGLEELEGYYILCPECKDTVTLQGPAGQEELVPNFLLCAEHKAGIIRK